MNISAFFCHWPTLVAAETNQKTIHSHILHFWLEHPFLQKLPKHHEFSCLYRDLGTIVSSLQPSNINCKTPFILCFLHGPAMAFADLSTCKHFWAKNPHSFFIWKHKGYLLQGLKTRKLLHLLLLFTLVNFRIFHSSNPCYAVCSSWYAEANAT